MRYKLFGRSGLRVSELCLGTAGFGLDSRRFGVDADWGSNAKDSQGIFEAFAEAGGNFIDTADVYGEGTSEKFVGELINSDRDHFVVATKYTQSFGQDLSKSGNSRKNMRRCVAESLKRLNTDHIDLYWLHNWDCSTPMDEILRGFDDLVSSGMVTYVAASNVPAWRLSSANTLADLRGWAPFVGIQVQYSLVERSAERELFPMAKELDLGITAWSPLGGGVLTGKYEDPGSRGRWTDLGSKVSDRQRGTVRDVLQVAQEIGCTPSQVALAWVRQQQRYRNAVIPIIGARTLSQITDNLGCLSAILSADQYSRLDEASAIEADYLERFLTMPGPGARSFSFAGRYSDVDNHRS